ncbi:hypothetical protein NC652_034119 [Populus alba x Populus x berolinensis]|uniref:Uncharacterized protein n=1 Tax=Populus alba x Populus x berolinensis TaxID=444605 RepID=A0AAD6LVG1_9ROSI|nr:hypothetical protein NC652_034119 [Populus alba x Populus x berolinensis]KAJ6973876.1 hypothetical protein NC653_034027 [Populus alba x Populus x berolinensis]
MEDCDSSQDSGNELLGLQHHYLNALHVNICLKSKMDSLHTTSETSSTLLIRRFQLRLLHPLSLQMTTMLSPHPPLRLL